MLAEDRLASWDTLAQALHIERKKEASRNIWLKNFRASQFRTFWMYIIMVWLFDKVGCQNKSVFIYYFVFIFWYLKHKPSPRDQGGHSQNFLGKFENIFYNFGP